MSKNSTHSYHSYNIQNLNQNILPTLNLIFSKQINYLLNFYKSHKIKQLNLQTSYQTTSTILQSQDLNLIKLLSLLTYLQFNNITNPNNLTSLINQLQFPSNLKLILRDTISEFGEVVETRYQFKTLD